MVTLEIRFYSLLGDYCCYLIKAEAIHLFSDFPKVFLQRVCSLFYVVTDVSSVTSVVSQWFDRNFLKCLNLIRREEKRMFCFFKCPCLTLLRKPPQARGVGTVASLCASSSAIQSSDQNIQPWFLEDRVPVAHPDTSSLQQDLRLRSPQLPAMGLGAEGR